VCVMGNPDSAAEEGLAGTVDQFAGAAQPGSRVGAAAAEEVLAGTADRHSVLSAVGNAVLLSGASDGADTLFGKMALRHEHAVVHFLGPRNEPSGEAAQTQAEAIYRVPDEVLDRRDVTSAMQRALSARICSDTGADAAPELQEAARAAARDALVEEWRDSRRNLLQVLRAHRVYAVAYRMPLDAAPSENPPFKRPRLDIGGGTGIACQMYVNRFAGGAREDSIGSDGAVRVKGCEDTSLCELYFYDDGTPGWSGCLIDPKTHRRWNRWDARSGEWVPFEHSEAPPKPYGRYAGIGGTKLQTDYGAAAICRLYEGSVRGSSG
jgi:hypothetical protein